jgi:hypothetical protein
MFFSPDGSGIPSFCLDLADSRKMLQKNIGIKLMKIL